MPNFIPKLNRFRSSLILGLIALHISAYIALYAERQDNDTATAIFAGFGTVVLLLLLVNLTVDFLKAPGLKKKLWSLVIWVVIGFLTIVVSVNLFDSYSRTSYPDDYPWTCDLPPEECAVIEDHAKVDVAQKQETKDLVKQFGSDEVTVRALAYEYITNPDYIERLLGDRYESVECIIYVDWPEGQRIYIEIDYHTYDQLTPEQFATITSDVDPADIQALYDNLH